MSRKALLPQSRRHLWIYDEDWAFLRKNFDNNGGVGPIVRQIIHLYVGNLKAKQQKAIEVPGAEGTKEQSE